jgi:ribosomal protein S18 acetylase RimI-like enzyme
VRHLNEYQFRTHPIGATSLFPESEPGTWRTDIILRGPVKDTSYPQGGRRVGYLEWESDTDVTPLRRPSNSPIVMVEVDEEHQRKGLATAALRHSQAIAKASGGRIPFPEHSGDRTPEGDAWAHSTGDPVPRNVRTGL